LERQSYGEFSWEVLRLYHSSELFNNINKKLFSFIIIYFCKQVAAQQFLKIEYLITEDIFEDSLNNKSMEEAHKPEAFEV